MHEIRTRRKIELADTDMVGIVHFARFFVFMETAEHDFLAALGTPVLFEDGGRPMSWPRVSQLRCQPTVFLRRFCLPTAADAAVGHGRGRGLAPHGQRPESRRHGAVRGRLYADPHRDGSHGRG